MFDISSGLSCMVDFAESSQGRALATGDCATMTQGSLQCAHASPDSIASQTIGGGRGLEHAR